MVRMDVARHTGECTLLFAIAAQVGGDSREILRRLFITTGDAASARRLTVWVVEKNTRCQSI